MKLNYVGVKSNYRFQRHNITQEEFFFILESLEICSRGC